MALGSLGSWESCPTVLSGARDIADVGLWGFFADSHL